jgi:two-component system LytT family response regulator
VKPTAVVVDDDALARERLRDLAGEVPLVEVIGEASDGLSAVRLVDELRPDIVFLDIEMPALNGLEVVRRFRHTPAVIFTTAYDQYAVTAFELSAVDYLLKPFGAARFREAAERAVASLGKEPAVALTQRLAGSLDPEPGLSRLFLREGDSILPVAVERISRFEADGDYVIVREAGDPSARKHMVRLRLQDLEDRLGDRFLRVHRSHLVNLDHVRVFEHQDDARLVVVMSDGARIVASRARSRELRRLAR